MLLALFVGSAMIAGVIALCIHVVRMSPEV